MNSWNGVGRLVRDVETRYSNEMAISKFTIAIDDGYGEKKKTNFIPIVVFGKTAENCEKYLAKGKKVGVTGRIQTGKYENKEGNTVYTTDVIADRVEFLDPVEQSDTPRTTKRADDDAPEGFQTMDDDEFIPF